MLGRGIFPITFLDHLSDIRGIFHDMNAVGPEVSSFFPAAVPFPPDMIAPACPIRLPGGAVCPEINEMTGLLNSFFMYSAASSSMVPPISPIMTTASVSSSSLNNLRISTKLEPITGIAADTDSGGLAHSDSCDLVNGFISEGSRLDTIPIRPFL